MIYKLGLLALLMANSPEAFPDIPPMPEIPDMSDPLPKGQDPTQHGVCIPSIGPSPSFSKATVIVRCRTYSGEEAVVIAIGENGKAQTTGGTEEGTIQAIAQTQCVDGEQVTPYQWAGISEHPRKLLVEAYVYAAVQAAEATASPCEPVTPPHNPNEIATWYKFPLAYAPQFG